MSNSPQLVQKAPKVEPPAILMRPWVDKAIAVIAMVPFMWTLYVRLRHFSLDIPRAALALQAIVFIGTMVFRRTPVRVSTKPWIWLLTLVETYWVVLAFVVIGPGRPLIPVWASGSIATLAAVIMLWARLTLGRSIGLVPAVRALVSQGPYRYVRHPIYLGGSLIFIANLLGAYSFRNLVVLAFGIFWFVLKCLAEESFLRSEPEYARYQQLVRWRMVPGLF